MDPARRQQQCERVKHLERFLGAWPGLLPPQWAQAESRGPALVAVAKLLSELLQELQETWH